MSFQSRSTWWKNKYFLSGVGVVIVGAVIGFAVLSGSEKKEEPAATTSTTTTTKEKITAPLTGLVDESGETQNRPAVAIKIGNNPEARPQAGINDADIMYEEIVEGGVTRYMGVYHSQSPERVGPVRSVRGMDPNIALNWGGVFAYSGGAAKNETKIQNSDGILALNETAAGDAMKRDSARSAPNNLYALPAKLFVKEGTPVPPRAQFTYSSQVPSTAQTASQFVVAFQGGFAATWTYDVETKRYLRSYGTKPVVDQEGEQTAYDNIVVQFITYPSESEGITTGTGDVWIFRNGKLVKGTWDRPGTSLPAEFTDSDGNVIALTPGQTWVALASKTTPVTVTP